MVGDSNLDLNRLELFVRSKFPDHNRVGVVTARAGLATALATAVHTLPAAHVHALSAGCTICSAARALHCTALLRRLDAGLAVQRGNLIDRKSTRLNSSHIPLSRMPSS